MRLPISASACLLLLLLAGCAATPVDPGRAGMDIVAEDGRFALVRLKPEQRIADLARVFLGGEEQAWQIREVNASAAARAGDIVAVPLVPLNPTSVYPQGYRILPVLCYHQFTQEKEIAHRLELRARDFERQLRYLVEEGYTFLSFADLDGIFRGGQPVPPKAVVLTIDDGYDSVYDVAWPLLKKYGALATLFIYTDFVGVGKGLTWEEMAEMRASGLIEIQSHAMSHTSLSRAAGEDDGEGYLARLQRELDGSAAAFEKHFGAAPVYFSYPYGNSSGTLVQLLREKGYHLAATVTRGDNSSFAEPYLLHRSMIYGDDDFDAFLRSLRAFRNKPLQWD